MRTFTFISILIAALSTLSLQAQHQNVMISDLNNCNEPSITLNPKNTNQLYAGANLNNYYYSDDGGFTWQEGTITSPEYGVWGDPVLVCDTAGAFYFFHLSNPQSGNWIDRIVCQKSSFGGNWNDGTFTGLNGTKAQDKHWVIVDRKTNELYCTWTQFDSYGTNDPNYFSNIMFSKSTDAGETWSPALQINEVSGDCVDEDNTTEGAVPAIGPNGELYVGWAGPEGLVFDRSLDDGNTWLDTDIVVSDIPGGWDYGIPGIYRANGLPVTLCDTSGGPNNGAIYINWTDQRNGADDVDVWLAKSRDGGDTWSQPIRVNDDPPGKQQFFTWMAIDQTNGYLYFVFYDRRNYEDEQTDVYMAQSIDGGESFRNFKISESPFVPNQNVFFGDYTNLTAYDNVIRPIWARLENSQLSIWTAIVDPTVVGIDEPLVDLSSLEQNYPNPFTESTYFSYKIHKTSSVTLEIHDQLGRLVAVLKDHEKTGPGKYISRFDASEYKLSPGVYYFSLITDDKSIRRKMVLN